MKARFAYPLLFGPVSAMSAALVAMLAVAFAAGVLWIFVHGDDPWPASAERFAVALGLLVFASTFVLLLAMLYRFGLAREARGGLAKRHVVAAVVATVVLPALVLLRQWRIGDIGHTGDGHTHPATAATPPTTASD